MYPIIHKRPQVSDSFERLDMLWERCPQYREIHETQMGEVD